MNTPRTTQEYRRSPGESFTGATAVRLLSRPQAGRRFEVKVPPARRLLQIFVGAIAIGSTAAAVGALYIMLSAVFPPGTLGFFLVALAVAVALSIAASFAFHVRASKALLAWMRAPSDDVHLDAWYQALNYPVRLSLAVGIAALAVAATVAVSTAIYAGSLSLGLHIAVGGALAAVLDAIFAWLYTDSAMRPILQSIAARNPLLPVSGQGIISLGLGAKMAVVIIGVSVVGAVVVGTLAYRGAEEAVQSGNVDGLALQILGVTLAGLAVSLSGCLLVARQVTGPLEDLTQMLEELIPERYSSRALPIDSDEAGQLMAAVNQMLGGLEEREFIKDAFSRYVTRQVSEVVLQGGLNLGGELLDVTILMSDIRDFTPMTERMGPRQLVRLLNRYFTEMVEACVEHGGLIDKFIGDAIMVVFGAPVRLPPEVSALRAARAALEMRRRLEALNVQLAAEGLPILQTGIGIHTGEAIAGNIGAPQRLDYTVIGDSVNLTARIEAATRQVGHDLLISEATREILGDWVEVGEVIELQLKGKSAPSRIYPLRALRPDKVADDPAAAAQPSSLSASSS